MSSANMCMADSARSFCIALPSYSVLEALMENLVAALPRAKGCITFVEYYTATCDKKQAALIKSRCCRVELAVQQSGILGVELLGTPSDSKQSERGSKSHASEHVSGASENAAAAFTTLIGKVASEPIRSLLGLGEQK